MIFERKKYLDGLIAGRGVGHRDCQRRTQEHLPDRTYQAPLC